MRGWFDSLWTYIGVSLGFLNGLNDSLWRSIVTSRKLTLVNLVSITILSPRLSKIAMSLFLIFCIFVSGNFYGFLIHHLCIGWTVPLGFHFSDGAVCIVLLGLLPALHRMRPSLRPKVHLFLSKFYYCWWGWIFLPFLWFLFGVQWWLCAGRQILMFHLIVPCWLLIAFNVEFNEL